MVLAGWYFDHKLLIDIGYLILLIIPSFTIYLLTKKLHRISNYDGIKYFKDAFLFYTISIFASIITNLLFALTNRDIFLIGNILGEYGLTIAGFYLLFSLVWKEFKNSSSDNYYAGKLILLHIVALIIGILDFLMGVTYLMFAVQIIVFAIAIFISFRNYMHAPKIVFLKYYFLAMVLFFISWVINFIAEFTINISSQVLIYNLILNLVFFYLFMIGVLLLAKK